MTVLLSTVFSEKYIIDSTALYDGESFSYLFADPSLKKAVICSIRAILVRFFAENLVYKDILTLSTFIADEVMPHYKTDSEFTQKSVCVSIDVGHFLDTKASQKSLVSQGFRNF